jgi:hypothetical protein
MRPGWWLNTIDIPCNQSRPTISWVPGQTVIDMHSMSLPVDLAPGVYTLTAGLYRADTIERLPAYDAQGQRWPEDAVVLGTIEVLP